LGRISGRRGYATLLRFRSEFFAGRWPTRAISASIFPSNMAREWMAEAVRQSRRVRHMATICQPLKGMRPIVGYIIAMLIGLIVVLLVPWISIGFLQ
jgi:hypothetical protein